MRLRGAGASFGLNFFLRCVNACTGDPFADIPAFPRSKYPRWEGYATGQHDVHFVKRPDKEESKTVREFPSQPQLFLHSSHPNVQTFRYFLHLPSGSVSDYLSRTTRNLSSHFCILPESLGVVTAVYAFRPLLVAQNEQNHKE
jgi:hypothetical protein